MTRENVETKGRRYLTEGRLRITLIDGEMILATCRGSDQDYTVGFWHGRWKCSCEARGVCCHLVALQLVARRPR